MEIWKDIPGYEGKYRVSDQGRVYSLLSSRLLTLSHNTAGYRVVSLYYGGVGKSHQVHQLVVLAFVGPPPDGKQIRHLDGNPKNNKLSNLCYGTAEENAADREQHGRTYRGTKHWKNKLSEEQVSEFLQRASEGELLKDLAKEFGIAEKHAVRIHQCKAWTTTHNPDKHIDYRKGRLRGSRTLTDEQIEEAYRLLDSGMSQREVGKLLGVSQQPIHRLVKIRKGTMKWRAS